MCSTPFGITDEIASTAYPQVFNILVCSTPFGITDEIATSGTDGALTLFRAQRLSASQMKSRPES